jgi:hypothetical protein
MAQWHSDDLAYAKHWVLPTTNRKSDVKSGEPGVKPWVGHCLVLGHRANYPTS